MPDELARPTRGAGTSTPPRPASGASPAAQFAASHVLDINGARCTFAELQDHLDDGGEPPTILTVAVGKGRDFAWSGAVDGLRVNDTVFDFEERGRLHRRAVVRAGRLTRATTPSKAISRMWLRSRVSVSRDHTVASNAAPRRGVAVLGREHPQDVGLVEVGVQRLDALVEVGERDQQGPLRLEVVLGRRGGGPCGRSSRSRRPASPRASGSRSRPCPSAAAGSRPRPARRSPVARRSGPPGAAGRLATGTAASSASTGAGRTSARR